MDSAERVLIVTPAHNEAHHLEAVAQSVLAQRRRPDRWLIVDDCSTDATLAVARRLEQSIDFLRVLEVAPVQSSPESDRLAMALDARAFNFALSHVDWREFEFIGKLDGDIVLDPAHFESLLAEFRSDPELGITGTYIEEDHGRGWSVNPMPPYHVNGAVKLYRRDCFARIGGIREVLSWDAIDGAYARMLGFRTRSIERPRARHLRRSGAAGGFLRGRARHGECVWLVNYPFALVLARTAREFRVPPYGLAAAAFLFGYIRAAIRRKGRIDDPQLLRFSRLEQKRRLRSAVRELLGPSAGA